MSRTFAKPPVHVTRRADNRADPSIATLRDRAIIGTIRYANASVDAITGLRVKDYYSVVDRSWLRILQDGVERHQLVEAKLESLLDGYLRASGIKDEPDSLLFRSTQSRTGKISKRSVRRHHVARLARQIANLNSVRLTPDNATRLINEIRPISSENLRDRAILGMMLYVSATPREIAGFRTSHYLDNGQWCCIKLSRSRIVEVPDGLATLLRNYVRAENPPNDVLLFRVDRSRGMTPANILKMIQHRLHELRDNESVG